MRTFWKKSSLAFLLAVLVLLTGILVGTAVTAAAEEAEPEYEAALFNVNGAAVTWDPDGDSVKTPIQGTLEEVIKSVYQHSSTANYRLVLYKDAEIEEAGLIIKPIAEFDGQGHTVYIDDSINVEATTHFFNITHQGTTVFKNINFVGQDMDWDGKVETMKTFGKTNASNGAIYVPQTAHFEMQNCTMTAFRTLGRAACVYFNQNKTITSNTGVVTHDATVYNSNLGVWLKDTQLVGNYAGSEMLDNNVMKNTEGYTVFIPNSGVGYWGDKLHISGNTVIKDNYHNITGAPTANVYLNYTSGTMIESSLMVVEEDFTGLVGMNAPGGMNRDEAKGRRGCVFFVGDSYDSAGKYARPGAIFVGAGAEGKIWCSPQGATTNTFMHMVPEDETTPWGCYLITAGISANYSVLTDTVKLTVMDASGEKELFTGEMAIKNGAILSLPTWATWTDAKWGTASKTHANGTDYIGKLTTTDALVLASADGKTWTKVEAVADDEATADTDESKTAFRVAIGTKAYKYVEVTGDLCLTESVGFAYYADMIVDFNGYTVTRANKNIYINAQGTSGGAYMDITIRNGIFDGTITAEDGTTSVPTDGMTLLRANTIYNTYTIEDCTFKNFDTREETTASANGGNLWISRGAVLAGNSGTFTLKNVKSVNCNGRDAAFYFTGVKVYIEGDTQIFNGTNDTKNIMYLYNTNSTLGLTGTFTGRVVTDTSSTTGANDPVCVKGTDLTAAAGYCTIPEGAQVLGKISHARSTALYAYNNQGVLCWTMVGSALPAYGSTPLAYDAENNKILDGSTWFYVNANGEEVATTVSVANVYEYGIKAIVAPDAEAVIDGATLTYGNLADVIAAASAGQIVEVLKDVTGVHNLNITKPITIDGNGKTLTWRLSPDPVAEENINSYMIRLGANGIVLKNIVFHGGAAEVGVWDGPLTPLGAKMLSHNAEGTIENCVFTGARIETKSRDDGAILGYNNTRLVLKNVTLVDNIIKINDTTTYNAGPHIARQGQPNALNFEGKVVIKDNYRIMSDGKVYQGNLQIYNTARVTFGQLTEGSEVHTFWAGSFMPQLNAEGKPYNNSGYFYSDTASTAMNVKTQDDGSLAISGNSSWRSKLSYTGTQIDQVSGVSFGETVDTQGGIASDRFELYYMPAVTADYYGTDVVVKINGEEVARKNLSEYAVSASKITVDVAVGMAELTDGIVLELQDAETKEVYATWSTTAKSYANALMALETLEAKTKAAVASLLRYGARVQTFFNHNVENLAMTPAEEVAWIEAGYLTGIGEGLAGGDAVKATQNGSVSGITIYGATLTMENQMSLRLYFTADSLEGYTFTVGGQVAEVKEGKGMYYIEAAHIGTASLATAVDFVITKGGETMTYTASPMSYVFAVFGTQNAQITDGLKAACEALYYYFVAAGECFGFDTNIGFTSALQESVDPVNAYSIPYGITAA